MTQPTTICRSSSGSPVTCLGVRRYGAHAWPAVVIGLLLATSSPARGDNFTQGTAAAQKFGTHEIVLTGDGSVSNPFTTVATVTFTPPSGSANAKTVDAFYDGGNTWRARAYVTEIGTWQWKSSSATDPGLVGWYRPHDGTVQPGGKLPGGAVHTLTAPWVGYDAVLRLLKDGPAPREGDR